MDHSPDGEPSEKKIALDADGLIKTSNYTSNKIPPTNTLTVDEVQIEILPAVYEIIRSVEKEPVDIAARQREAQECAQRILELQKHFDSARSQIKRLRGIDYNKEEQLKKLELLHNQLTLKQELIRKYKEYRF